MHTGNVYRQMDQEEEEEGYVLTSENANATEVHAVLMVYVVSPRPRPLMPSGGP